MVRAVGRAAIAPGVLKGYLLEEVVASLISNAGYRLLTSVEDDPYDLAMRGNGLQVRGRGGLHQADVVGELAWAPAFGAPIRLFVEAKWRANGRGRLGIPEVRHAVGVLQDVNQSLITIGSYQFDQCIDASSEDSPLTGRGFCYSYRYSLCSTSGFTSGAQAYALAHQVALLDLSHTDYDEIRNVVDRVGDDLVAHINLERSLIRDENATSRGSIVKLIRATLRRELWSNFFGAYDETVAQIINPLIQTVRDVGELFVGVSATGFVILLKADRPKLMVRHMQAQQDPNTSIYLHEYENGSTQWQIILQSEGLPDCSLSFALPDAMLHALNERRENGRSAAMLNFKEQHFSRLTVYRFTELKSLICSLKLDRQWLDEAKRASERRRRPNP